MSRAIVASSQSNLMLADLEGSQSALLGRSAHKSPQDHSEVVAPSQHLFTQRMEILEQKGRSGQDHTSKGRTNNAQSVWLLPWHLECTWNRSTGPIGAPSPSVNGMYTSRLDLGYLGWLTRNPLSRIHRSCLCWVSSRWPVSGGRATSFSVILNSLLGFPGLHLA